MKTRCMICTPFSQQPEKWERITQRVFAKINIGKNNSYSKLELSSKITIFRKNLQHFCFIYDILSIYLVIYDIATRLFSAKSIFGRHFLSSQPDYSYQNINA